MKKIIYVSLNTLMIILISSCSSKETENFTLSSGNKIASVYVIPNESYYVHLAVNDFISDVEKITGNRLLKIDNLKSCNNNCIIVGSVELLEQYSQIKEIIGGDMDGLKGKWEAYRVNNYRKDNHYLIISGSDSRGTMFGIYDFIENYLGVDPMYFWTDFEPRKQKELVWSEIDILQEEPTFKFRGWFINDEDLLSFWKEGGERHLDYKFYSNIIATDAIRPAVEALVRSRYNLFIPASFINILNPAEEEIVKECARRGVFISQHHQEPMGVHSWSYTNYWIKKGRWDKHINYERYSYITNKEDIQEVWRAATQKWAKYPNVIWQLGLRGVGDTPVWRTDTNVPESDEERGRLISRALADQVSILEEICPEDHPKHTSITLWMEGSDLNEKGLLKIPESTIIVFSDNSPGWVMQPDFYKTEREPGRDYGIYYHHQLWGAGPHLVQGVPPSKTYEIVKKAVDYQSHDYIILNVGNIREFPMGIKASSEMLYNFYDFDPDKFITEWCNNRFGEAASEVEVVYRQYFDSFQIHDKTNIIFLLDGQIRSHGLRFLGVLERYANAQGKLRIDSSYGDARWGIVPFAEFTQLVKAQREDFSKTIEIAEQARDKLEGQGLNFFEVNLIAQNQMILGLTTWLDALLGAMDAESTGNREGTIKALEDALSSFEMINSGKELASRGEKWENWYRGEMVLNVRTLKERTIDVLNAFKSNGVN